MCIEQVFILAILATIGAVAGAGLGKYYDGEQVDVECKLADAIDELTGDDQKSISRSWCTFFKIYQASFCLGLVAALLCAGSVVLIGLTFCLEQLAVATKILVKIAMFVALACLVVALVGMPVSYDKVCNALYGEYADKLKCDFFDENLKAINDETTLKDLKEGYYIQEMWYSYLVAAVMCAASGIVSFFCRP